MVGFCFENQTVLQFKNVISWVRLIPVHKSGSKVVFFKTQRGQSFVTLRGLQITEPLEVVLGFNLAFLRLPKVCGVLSGCFRTCKWEGLMWAQHFVRKISFLFEVEPSAFVVGQGEGALQRSARQNSWKELWCSPFSRCLLRMWFHFENLLPRKWGASCEPQGNGDLFSEMLLLQPHPNAPLVFNFLTDFFCRNYPNSNPNTVGEQKLAQTPWFPENSWALPV